MTHDEWPARRILPANHYFSPASAKCKSLATLVFLYYRRRRALLVQDSIVCSWGRGPSLNAIWFQTKKVCRVGWLDCNCVRRSALTRILRVGRYFPAISARLRLRCFPSPEVNKTLSFIGARCPSAGNDLLSARAGLKHYLGEGGGRKGRCSPEAVEGHSACGRRSVG